MSALTNGGGRLAHALDRDVLSIAQRFLDDEASPIPRVHEVYTHIMRSNSSLKRRPKKQLEASIERVLETLREDRAERDSDGSDVMDAIEGDFADASGATLHAGRGLNKGLTRLWASNINSNGNLNSNSNSNSNGNSNPNGNLNSNTTDSNVKSAPETDKAAMPESEPTRKVRRAQEPAAKRRKLAEADRSPPVYASFEQLGGVDEIRDQLEDLLALPLIRPDIYESAGFEPPRGVLLHGPPGCGKTAIANAVAASMRVPFISISGPSVVSGMSGESERALRDHFEEAKKLAPCIIFIDEIDAITPKRDAAQRQMETRIVAQLLTCMDDLAIQKTGGKVVVVIAATNRPDSLDPALRRGGRFDTEITMPIPNERTRKQILETLTRPLPLDGTLNLDALAKRTAGFVGADLKDLVNRSAQIALRRFRVILQGEGTEMQLEVGDELTEGSNSPGLKTPVKVLQYYQRLETLRSSRERPVDIHMLQADFEVALPMIQPSSKREGFATVPDTSWKDVGALQAIREELMFSIVEPILNPKIYQDVGITAPAGVLLWGPPGCGKTLLAKAVANESKANFISVKGPELMNKYVGESEREVRLLFTRARSSVPCVIFFDELDALAPRRGSEMTESSNRVVNTLLTEMDGLAKREGIYLIGATNRPDQIEPAILRPGRLETPLYVDLPGPDERVEILETQCRNAKVTFSPEVGDIARSCDRFSGADLEALRTRAGREAVKRRSHAVELEDWQRAAQMVNPSVDPRTEKVFKRLLKTFGNAVLEERLAEES